MSRIVHTKCPHCRVEIAVERPHEPRTAPCPACSSPILIPPNWRPRQATRAPLRPAVEQPAIIQRGWLTGRDRLPGEIQSPAWLVFAAAACLVLGILLGRWLSPLQGQSQSWNVPAPDPLPPAPRYLGEERMLRDQKAALDEEVARLKRERDEVNESIKQMLGPMTKDLGVALENMKGSRS